MITRRLLLTAPSVVLLPQPSSATADRVAALAREFSAGAPIGSGRVTLDLPVLVEMDSATPAPKKGFRFWLNKKPANSESGQGTYAIGQKQAAAAEA